MPARFIIPYQRVFWISVGNYETAYFLNLFRLLLSLPSLQLYAKQPAIGESGEKTNIKEPGEQLEVGEP